MKFYPARHCTLSKFLTITDYDSCQVKAFMQKTSATNQPITFALFAVLPLNPLTSVPAWAGLDFARVHFWPQPPLERLFWSPFVLVVFGNVQPIRIHQLRIYLKAWGGPRREDFLSLSKKITFHSKWLPCSSRVNFQDGNISLSEGRITFWNLKIERRSSKEHSTS